MTMLVQPRKETVSIRDAADLLGVCYETVWRLVKSGHLQAFRVGRVWRIRRIVIVEYAHRDSTQFDSRPLS